MQGQIPATATEELHAAVLQAVLTAAVGAQGLLAVIVGNLIVTLIMVPLTMVILQLAAPSKTNEKDNEVLLVERSLIGAVKQPLVWLPLLGAVLAIAGVRLPDLIDNSVEQIGQAAGGVALFTLGLMLAQNPVRLGRDVVVNVALKNLIQPTIILSAALAFRLDSTLIKEVFLIGVMPSAGRDPGLQAARWLMRPSVCRPPSRWHAQWPRTPATE